MTNKKTRFTGDHEKPPTGRPARSARDRKTDESQENRSEQTYRPLGDRLGPAEPAQMAQNQ